MNVRVACIVEGDGDVKAVPVLIRRIAAERVDAALYVEIPRPVIVKRARVAPRFSDFENKIEQAVRSLSGPGGLLVLLDSDRDCPAQLGPQLMERAGRARSDLPAAVVLARSEYECWFLAAAESLAGKRGLPNDLKAPPQPEEIQGAKEWLSRRWPPTRKYAETTDQPALTSALDLHQAATNSTSFRRCCREIERLLRVLLPPASEAGESGAPSPPA